MTVSPFDSTLFGALLSCSATAAAFSDEAFIKALLVVEGALARAEAAAGVIPEDAADEIAKGCETLTLDPADLADGTASAGVPVPALVAALRDHVGGAAAAYVHWGATSQDIVDTALVVRLRPVLDDFDARLAALCDVLAALSDAHVATVMVARTRSQQAVPTTFGNVASSWRAPLVRQRERLAQLRPRLLRLSLGGAGGTLAALGGARDAVAEAMARDLELGLAETPWHTERDGIAELASWLSLVTGSLGKMGRDLVLLAQTEVNEVRPGVGGGSSTMPQKANPVAAEALSALAAFAAAQVGAVHGAQGHAQQRDGAAWALEWLALPPLVTAAGAALRQAASALDGVVVDDARMASNLAAANGLVLAEAATFALAAHMPRQEAEKLVHHAVDDVTKTSRHLVDVLADLTDAPVDWSRLKDPASYL